MRAGASDDRRDTYTVLLYSDDPQVRDRMRLAIGPRPARRPRGRVRRRVDLRRVPCGWSTTYEIDLMVLDGEAAPAGGLGIARQIKDEIADPPPTCVVIARAADRWLAAYAQVDATLIHPLDPVDHRADRRRHAPRPPQRRDPAGR